LITAMLTYAGPHAAVSGANAGPQLEVWQVINLIGAPMLALLFLGPVIDDLKAWIRAVRQAN
jgi:hypothetical protein